MTAPGAGQNINLAALWIPVMPDTAHMGEEMRKAGGEAKSQFEQGFNSSGSSPENIGQSFGSKLISSINREMKGLELPLGTSSVFEKLNGEVDKNADKLRGKASEALKKYSEEYDKLGAAQARASEAEQKVNAAREAGFSKASILLPLIQEQTAAQNALKEAHVNTTAALDDYNGHLGRLSEAHREAANSGSMMAGIMGGAVVAGVGLAVSAVDKLAEGVVEGFKMAIEISKELAEKTLELGETYEHIGIQIHEFSDASGEEFENMEKSAQRVFSTLDVGGADVGKTMAQLSSSMGVPAQSIESLVHNVTDLQGRFTSLKTQDLASVFVAFKTPAKDADSAVASLLKSSRESGQDLGVLTQSLSGLAGLTLKEAGLNLQQAGAFMGDMLKYGEPGRQVMTGMSSAMKEFGKEGISFKDGMQITAETLKNLGNTAEGQDLAEKLFGTRNWVVAKDAAEQYLEVVEKGPDAFSANADTLTEFIDKTETLGNKFEEFKHKAEDVFKPFGTAAQTLATQGLNSVSTWFSTHQPEILGDIKSWGDKMIDEIPTIQKFAEDGLRIFGDFSQVILAGLAPITLSLGVAGAGALALTGHFSDAKDLMIAAAKIPATPIADMANTMADKIAAMHIDTQGIRDDFDAAVNSALAMPPGIGSGVRGSAGAFSSAGPASVGPGGMATAGGPAGFPGGGAASASGTGSGGTDGAQRSDTNANRQLAQQMFPWSQSEWAAFDELEMHEAGYDSTAKNPQSGAFGMGQFLGHENDAYAAGYSTDPATQLSTMFQYIADRYGTPSKAWAQYYQHPKGQGYYVTGGTADHPGGPRGTDTVPAWLTPGEEVIPVEQADKFRPLLKAITAGHFDQGGTASWDAVMAAADRMAGGKTGGLDLWIAKAAEAAGVDAAHWAPGLKVLVNRESSGSPTVVNDWDSNAKKGTPSIGLAQVIGPTAEQYGISGAMLTDPVSNLTAAIRYIKDRYGDISKVQQANPKLPPKGYYGGGTVNYLSGGGTGSSDYAASGAGDDLAGVNAQISFVDQIAKGFGLTLTAGKSGHGTHSEDGGYHDTGEAGDFSDGMQTDTEYAFAAYMIEHFGSELAEVIHTDPRLPKLIKDGKLVDAQQVYGPWLDGHKDHVHIAVKSTQAMSDLSPGSESLSGGIPPMPSIGGPGSTPRGKNGVGYTGLAGQYGGLGVYGGETADQAFAAQQAVQEAQDHQADLDWRVSQNQKKIDDLNAELAQGDPNANKPGLLPGTTYAETPAEQKAWADKQKSLNEQLSNATHELAVSQREQGEQGGKVTEAMRKQQEAMYKKPSTQAGGNKDAQALGSGLLAGIGEELGLGTVLGKSPLDWGIVKLAEGLFNYANGLGDAIFGQTNGGIAGGTPGGAQGLGGGLVNGLLGSVGIKAPTAMLSAGPNVVPGAPPGAPGDNGYGPPPGPGTVINGDVNPIHISPNIDPSAVLNPVIGMQRDQAASTNANSFTYSGGVPAQ